jgi:hypothetical protein
MLLRFSIESGFWSRMPNAAKPHKQRFTLTPQVRAAALAVMARPQSESAALSSLPAVAAQLLQPVDLPAPRRTQIPEEYLSVQSRALSSFDDNPLLGTCGAAKILSVGVELLKKWRQRDQGPDYVQYGPGGPVRYELDALMAFRALHRVRVSSKP